MKKTFALILACCLLTGCSFNSGISDFGESADNSYISPQSSSENYSEPISESASASSGASDEPSVPASSPEKPQSSSSKPQSSSSKPQSSSSKPQSSPTKPQSSSSKPQSSPTKPQSSSTKPQSSSTKPQSSSSKPQSSSSKPQSSSSVSEPQVPEVIGPYGQRAQEDWEIEFSNEVFRLTNIERVKNGLPEFKHLALLDEVANIRAWEQIPLYGHDRPDGRSCFTAYKEAGISYSAAAENVAAGYPTPEAVVDGWMNSPGHRENILDPDLKYLGVGFYYDKERISTTSYRYYWSQNFCTTR